MLNALLQAKYKRFQQMDVKKYESVLRMHADEAIHLAKNVLTADRILHEQQLGWDWQAPDEAVFMPPTDPAEANAAAAKVR